MRQTYGYAKEGTGRGYTGVKGLNALLAIVSTSSSASVIAAARLRKDSTNSVKGAARLIADALSTAKAAGATRVRVLRADSAFYNRDVIAAAVRHQSCFSITARQDPGVRKTIATIEGDAWAAIKYTNAIFDEGPAAVDLRRRGRRDLLHRVHLQSEGKARDGPVDRATGQGHEP